LTDVVTHQAFVDAFDLIAAGFHQLERQRLRLGKPALLD